MNTKIAVVSLALTAVLYGANSQAQAGLFVEPAITYEVGSSSVDYPSPLDNSSGSVNGFGIGARVGFHVMETVFLALDGRYSKPTFKDSSNDISVGADAWHLGATAGAQMPIMGIRVWGSYLFAGKLDPGEDGGFDVAFNDGRGYRFGVGARVSVVSLNLEYQRLNYGTTKVDKVGPFETDASFDDVDLDDNAWILSASFPLEF